MESGTGGAAYGDGVGAELARLRDALDDLRRRPIPLDVATLRHVVTASLAEASAPPPNLLVTAIRRLDRVDARLETIEALLGGPAALPRGAPPQGSGRGRPAAVSAPAPPPMPTQYVAPPDAEAIAEALARRLAGVLSQAPAVPGGGGATVEDLIAAVRPLVPGAARAVLRRAGREPSPQAVEVLQQTALHALVDAADSLGPFAPSPSAFAAPLEPPRFSPPALAPAPPPARAAAPPPEPLDLDALAATIAARVADAVVATLPSPVAPAPRPPVEEPVRRQPERPAPPPPPFDPGVVADAVISRLAQQPPPPAVVSPMAMAPLLSAVGNVEAAVAQLAEPDGGVVVAVDRLEAGVEALARALEEDRSAQADEVRRGFAELTSLLRFGAAAQPLAPASGGEDRADRAGAGPPADEGAPGQADASASSPGVFGGVAGIHRRLDRLTEQLAPLAESDLATAVPELAAQNQRVERSLGNILTALAALAEHLHEQTAAWQAGFDALAASLAAHAPPSAPVDLAPLQHDLRGLAGRLDDLVPGTAADRQRFQRLGGTIDGLAQLLGQVSERLDRLPRRPPTDDRSAPGPTGDDGEEPPADAVAAPPRGPDVDERAEDVADVATSERSEYRVAGAGEAGERSDSREGTGRTAAAETDESSDSSADTETGDPADSPAGLMGIEGIVDGGVADDAADEGRDSPAESGMVAGVGSFESADGEGVGTFAEGAEGGGIGTNALGVEGEGRSADEGGDGVSAESIAQGEAGEGVGRFDDGAEGGGRERAESFSEDGGHGEDVGILDDGADGAGRNSADEGGAGERATSIASGGAGEGVRGLAEGVGTVDDGGGDRGIETIAVGMDGGEGATFVEGDGTGRGGAAEGGEGEIGESTEDPEHTADPGGEGLDHDEDLEDSESDGRAEDQGDWDTSSPASSGDGLDVDQSWLPDAGDDAPDPAAEMAGPAEWPSVGTSAVDRADVAGAGRDGAAEEPWPGDPGDALAPLDTTDPTTAEASPARLEADDPAGSEPGGDQAGPAEDGAEIAQVDEVEGLERGELEGLDDHAVVAAADTNGAGGEEVAGRRGRGRRRRGKRRG